MISFFTSRRKLLTMFGAGALLVAPQNYSIIFAKQSDEEIILQPETPDDSAFIHRAFAMRQLAVAQGDQPYGAVVVREGKIIGQSWSRVILDHDPTGHAEMSAIRNAAHRQKDRFLNDCILYSSSHPCPMCEAAAYWSGITQMIYGKGAIKAGAPKLCR